MSQSRYSKHDYVKSSPYFFRLILIAMLVIAIILFCGSIIIQPPLLEPANAGITPNPAKSAWFLLWIQELVSYGTFLIYPVIFIAITFVLLPWLPVYKPVWRASWFPRGQLAVNILTFAAVAVILWLSIVAAFFRGAQWQFISPF